MLQPIPKEVDVIITQELIQKSGEFSDINHCPVATLFTELFQENLEPGFLPQASIHNVHIQCRDSLHKYKLHPTFLYCDYEEVVNTGNPYRMKAYLEY